MSSANIDPELEAESEMADTTSSTPGNEDIQANGTTDNRPKHKAKRITKQLLKEADSPSDNGNSKPLFNLRKITRRPRTGKGRGLAKKGGGGGKHTWGKPGCEIDYVDGSRDVNDLNYDSDSQDNVKLRPVAPELSSEELARAVEPLIKEYFEHGDTADVIGSMFELACAQRLPDLPYLVITLAMERHNPQRELASLLISDMYLELVAESDIEFAFDRLLNELNDLSLDTPDAHTVVGNFIARAVADDCLQPKYVQNYKGKVQDEKAILALDRADLLLGMKHGLVRLDNVWGVGGGIRPVKTLIKKMVLLVKEFLSSGDAHEAIRCLQELEVPHFHHELVFEAIMIVIEEYSERTSNELARLLKTMTSSAVITSNQLTTGFIRIFENLSDICLDVPNATTYCEEFAAACEKLGFLTPQILNELPSKGRKRFVSEGDGGLEKPSEKPLDTSSSSL